MRPVVRGLAAAVAALLVGAAVFAVPTFRGRPWSIDHFFSRVFVEFALARPQLLSRLRILEPWGLDFHADDLDDFSPAFARAELEAARGNLATLREYDRAALAPGTRRSRDVLEWFLETAVDGEPFLLHDFPVNQLNGVQSGLPDFMLNVHQLGDARDAEDYRERLAKFGIALDQVIEGLEARREAGIVPPRFVIERVRDEIAGFLATPPGEHLLVRHLEAALGEMEGLGPKRREALVREVQEVVAATVLPAYRRLDAALAGLLEIAPEALGVWQYPGGAAYYAWALRRHTTTDLGADEIHALGLREVARLRGEIEALLAAEGAGGEDLGASLRAVAAAPRFVYPDSAEGRAAILRDYQAIVDGARERLPALFGRLPRAPVRVERVPEFMQEGAPLAYYQPPPFDSSRPGFFYANLRNVAEHRRFRMRTLAHHEAVPGHHLQIALAMEQEGVPFFRRVLPFTAFTEGWALYAEQLAAEQGLLPTRWDDLGRLVDEMFRAVRLVVDTGIHARRWSRERAIAYMEAHTGKPHSEVVAEIERYAVLPGQACAYTVGQLEILRLRTRARQALGPAFDLRDFHDVVLRGGALPLSILERAVEDWIAERRASAEAA